MPPDPLENPIAFLTDHPVLAADAEAALIATMRAGVEAREAIRRDLPPADPAVLHQVALGEEARATLVRHNLRLVVSIAKRYLRVAGPHLTLEDLISFGSIGLLQGIDKFDPRKSGRLSTYVTWWIRQAIGRGIAEESRVIDLPVHVHERLGQQRKARSRLTQQLGREPSPDELAGVLGWRPQQIAQLEAIAQETMSLSAKVHDANDRTELGDLVPDTRFDPEAATLDTTLRADLAAVMHRLLTEREQRFLRAYFGFDTGQPATLEAVGATEGLTRERVRQVIAGAIGKLRGDPAVMAYREPSTR
ncbi:MAG: sigma-70 family RNA polymerase sigma factor [Chloroflexales bacterium]|nr:sigma-70 family RNA polymerase sigma factor [Chloroflexales bacterium]